MNSRASSRRRMTFSFRAISSPSGACLKREWNLYSSEVLRVVLGVFLPLRALVIHRVLQAVPVFRMGGVQHVSCLQGHPFSCKYWRAGKLSIMGCLRAHVFTPSTVVLSRPLQQPYTPPGSSEVTYELRSFTKKSDDSLVGQRQSFVVVQQAYDTSTPRPESHVRERAGVERERVRSGRLGGVPPQLADQARLTRVLTHRTWEKTTVATSRPGSKIGCLVSGADMSLEVEMATSRG